VVITTERPQDRLAPVATLLPEPVVVLDLERGTPVVEVELEDDTGIESAIVEYEVITAAGQRQGRLRLEMNPRSPRRFSGGIPIAETVAPSDRIEYRIRVRDFDENEAVFPRIDDPAFAFEYRQVQSVNALLRVRQTGLWARQGSGWAARAGGEELPRSSLVLEPIDLAENTAGIELELFHRWRLAGGAGGNVKVSADGAQTWHVLEPAGGYPGSLAFAGDHPMRGEAAFTGEQDEQVVTRFDVSEFAGRQLRLRIDFGTERRLSQDEYWRVDSAQLLVSTRDDAFEVPRELSLHANYPNPFATTTTVGYTVPQPTIVRLSVYDMMGRRVALLVHAEHVEGTYIQTFDGSGLAAGVYMLYLETENGRRAQKMIVTR
jgi:hypothetical protein